MKVQELKERKKEKGYTNEMVAKLSGVPVGTVQKIFSGATAAPRYETLQALERALFPELFAPAGSSEVRSYAGIVEERPARVRETEIAYSTDSAAGSRRQGEYTVGDYLAIPEDARAELIDGDLYDMGTPTYIHQFLLGQLYAEMLDFQRRTGHGCLPFLAPLAVQLDCDDKTMVEPDLIVLCDRKKLKQGRIFGAPDLLVEIVSPSGAKRDYLLKLNKYWKAGVREYWIVDPLKRTVTIYRFEEGDIFEQYTFEDRIPVGISDGELVIDMKEISDRMRELLPEE